MAKRATWNCNNPRSDLVRRTTLEINRGVAPCPGCGYLIGHGRFCVCVRKLK
jgi:hypothetical protein